MMKYNNIQEKLLQNAKGPQKDNYQKGYDLDKNIEVHSKNNQK